ncbi:hypothetical protein GCM10017783_10600 [Deinococcus piscis]|uniref:Lipoprotein n=1 Tax=Deinococcus piscis TaxID=394230 RepID=A0ABQ3K6P6_9DEIO|nr:hypothetical protein [Deinococcus piscis]GHG00345.1 hypothetical protein GCM10017783_10600 [Deinococcus piscis]
MKGRPSSALTLCLAALLGAALTACQPLLDRGDLEWGEPGEAVLKEWREGVEERGPQRWQLGPIQSVTLTYPKGTQTAVSVQVDSTGLSNIGIAEDVVGMLNNAYSGKPPASARYREEWTVGQVQREGNGINLCFYALRASLTPKGAPLAGRGVVTVDKPIPCPPTAQGGHGMSFRSLPLRLDEWNTVFFGRVGEPDGWRYAAAVYPSSQPLLHKGRAEGGMTVILEAQAGQAVEVTENGFRTPPVPTLAELRERLN